MATELYDPRIPPRENCIVSEAIDRWARDNPDKVFVLFADGTSWTFRQLREVVRQTALGLQQLGVRQGDYVMSWLPNGPDALRISFAINYLGAVNVPANLAYRGNLLAHVVRNSQAKLIVLHADLLPRLDDIDCAALTQGVVLGGAPRPHKTLQLHPAECAVASLGRSCAARAADRAVGHPDGDLHIGHHGTVEGRAVVVSAYLHRRRRAVPVSDRRRSLSDQPADVPHRRLRHPELHADDRRIGRDRRILRDRKILVRSSRRRNRPRRRCSA